MITQQLESLKTTSEIGRVLGVQAWRIAYVVSANSDIQPVTIAGNTRLFDTEAVRRISAEIERIDAKRRPVVAR